MDHLCPSDIEPGFTLCYNALLIDRLHVLPPLLSQ
uniref:Uncharacterized protein n=1 Tax=Anguilla anguilla TaxID=7936 RepID=A0A0E9PIP4_ANGAN